MFLRRADLTNASLQHAEMYQVHLNEASLINASLQHAELIWVELTRANLTDAHLERAILTEIQDLNGAFFNNTTMPDGSIRNDGDTAR